MRKQGTAITLLLLILQRRRLLSGAMLTGLRCYILESSQGPYNGPMCTVHSFACGFESKWLFPGSLSFYNNCLLQTIYSLNSDKRFFFLFYFSIHYSWASNDSKPYATHFFKRTNIEPGRQNPGVG